MAVASHRSFPGGICSIFCALSQQNHQVKAWWTLVKQEIMKESEQGPVDPNYLLYIGDHTTYPVI